MLQFDGLTKNKCGKVLGRCLAKLPDELPARAPRDPNDPLLCLIGWWPFPTVSEKDQ